MGNKIIVKQYTIQGNFVKIWQSISEASRETETHCSSIKLVCDRKLKTSNNFIWRHEFDTVTEDDLHDLTKRKSQEQLVIERGAIKRRKPINQYSLDGVLIKEWLSAKEASEALGITRSGISRVCAMKQAKAGGFKWKYSHESEQVIANRMNSYVKRKNYNKLYRDNNKERYKKLRDINKAAKCEYDRQYRMGNKEIIKKRNANYYNNNKDKISKKGKQYYNNNKDKIKQYEYENKESISIRSKEYNASNAKYEVYKDKLTVDESPRVAKDGVSLEVKCRYCGNYFLPTNMEARHRVNALNATGGPKSLYCSEGCKSACPIYNQQIYPKGFKKATSREVQPQLRQLVLKRDSWRCQTCFRSVDEVSLHCHHILPLNESPVESADIDNCITLCKECHKEVHKLPGCNYYELRCE